MKRANIWDKRRCTLSCYAHSKLSSKNESKTVSNTAVKACRRHVYINSSLMRRNIARSDAQHSTINFNSYTNMFEFFHHLWKKRRAIKKNRPTKGNSQMKHRLPVFFFFSLRFWVGSLASTLIYVHHEVFRYKENISLNFSCGDAVY